MNDKRRRQAALVRLAGKKPLATQDEIVAALRNAGFSATQSSVSRDLRELGLVRVRGRYVPLTATEASEAAGGLSPRESELIISAEPVGANLIVVRTPPGSASAVAAELDRKGLPDIAGTLAGDDTIFLAVRSRAAQGRVAVLLQAAGGVERD